MKVEIARYALDRIPLSLIVDDSTVLVNANYFWMRDRNLVDGLGRRWEDVPVVHPESFTREWAEWCLENGVRGKFSIIPCPVALGRIDEGLSLFSRRQTDSWLDMCRELIVPNWDITPEMITHSYVVDPDTCQPLPSRIWEQYDWQTLPDDDDLLFRYFSTACRILINVGLMPKGVTSPGGFGGESLDTYARIAGAAVRAETGKATPYFFQRGSDDSPVDAVVWHADADLGQATGEIQYATGDWTGNWTGYGVSSADKYITEDLTNGRLVEVIDAGDPAVMCSHWQGFYGMHDEDRRGFHTLKTVVKRLGFRDPTGEVTRWRTCSQITDYACARSLASVAIRGSEVDLILPLSVPELTLKIDAGNVTGVSVSGVPLRQVTEKRYFESGTFLRKGDTTLAAFNPGSPRENVAIESAELS